MLGRCIALAMLIGTTSSASAQGIEESLDAEARGLYLAGRAAFDGGRYEEALGHFKRAYDLSERPGLLFNIGHTASLLGDHAQALEAFDAYVEQLPDAENADAVRTRAARLRERLVAEEPEDVEESQPAPEPETAPMPEPSRPSVAPWILVAGGGALTVTGAVLLGLAAGAAANVESAEEGSPWVDVQGDYDRARTFRIAGGVLGAVGIAALGVGVVWALSGPSDVEMALGPSGVQLRGHF